MATTVVAGNKTFTEDVVCMLVSNIKSYTNEHLLIPNSVNEIKVGKTSVAISNFSNEPKILRGAFKMIGYYEKLDDMTILLNFSNDLSNNRTDW